MCPYLPPPLELGLLLPILLDWNAEFYPPLKNAEKAWKPNPKERPLQDAQEGLANTV